MASWLIRRHRDEGSELDLRKAIAAGAGSEKFRFLLVGGYNTVFGYGLFGALIWLAGDRIHYLAILVLSHLVAVTNGYFAYQFFVFRDAPIGLASYARYHVVNLANLGFGAVGLSLLVELAHMTPLAAQALLVVAGVILSYILHKQYSFRR
jgi:putative flippase GtrA